MSQGDGRAVIGASGLPRVRGHLLPFGEPIPEWWDIFTFDDAPEIVCPDCDQVSPQLRDLREAAEWCDRHDCPA